VIALVRVDTQNYGWVVSRHDSAEQADEAYDLAIAGLPPNALPHCMYSVAETPEAGIGDRVRYAPVSRLESHS